MAHPSWLRPQRYAALSSVAQQRGQGNRPGGVAPGRWVSRVALSAAIAALVACAGDAPIPDAYSAKVQGARASLEQHWDGLPQPIFRFVAIRCRVDGGILVVFEERGGRHSGASAFAMQGPGAQDGPWAWAGGFGIRDIDADSEIRFFFSESPEAPCPPEPAAR